MSATGIRAERVDAAAQRLRVLQRRAALGCGIAGACGAAAGLATVLAGGGGAQPTALRAGSIVLLATGLAVLIVLVVANGFALSIVPDAGVEGRTAVSLRRLLARREHRTTHPEELRALRLLVAVRGFAAAAAEVGIGAGLIGSTGSLLRSVVDGDQDILGLQAAAAGVEVAGLLIVAVLTLRDHRRLSALERAAQGAG